MIRVFPGTDASMTFAVPTGGTYTAKVTDPLGRYISASASEDGGTVTITISRDAFMDGATGFGRLQIMRTHDETKTIEASETIKFLPGIAEDEPLTDYRWHA